MTSHFSENHDEKQITESNCKEDLSEQHVSYRWTLADAVDDLTLPVRSSSRIVYTCISVSKKLISIGTSTGAVYFFELSTLKNVGLKYAEKNASIRQILFSHNGQLLGVYTSAPQVEIWSVKERGLIVEKVRSISCQSDSKVTALCWHSQDVSLFIGFSNGNVTELNASLLKARSFIRLTADVIMKLDSEVVQIDCHDNKIVASTLTKSYLSSIDQGSYSQIGKKLREGQFGACFLSHSGNSFIYCSRPGLRLWQTDMSGVVMQTIQLKDTLPDALASCIDLKNFDEAVETSANPSSVPPTWQFKCLLSFRSHYLLTYKSPCLCVVDPIGGRVVAATADIEDVVDLALFDNYVLILHSDNRIQKLSCLSAVELVEKAAELALWTSCAQLCLKYESIILAEYRNASILDVVCRLQQALAEELGAAENTFTNKLKELTEKLSHYHNNNAVPLASKQASFTQLSSGLYVNTLSDDKLVISDGSRQNSRHSPTPSAPSSKINLVASVTHSLSSEFRRMKSKLVEPLIKKQFSRTAVDQSDTVSHSSVSTEEDRQSLDSLDVVGGGTEASGDGDTAPHAIGKNVSCNVDDCVSCSSGSTGVSSDVDDGPRLTVEGTVQCQTAIIVASSAQLNNVSVKAASCLGDKAKKKKNFRVISLDDSIVVAKQTTREDVHEASGFKSVTLSVPDTCVDVVETTTITADIVVDSNNAQNADTESCLSVTITAVDSDYDSSSLKDDKGALDDKMSVIGCVHNNKDNSEASDSLISEQSYNDACETLVNEQEEYSSKTDSLKTLTASDCIDGHVDGRQSFSINEPTSIGDCASSDPSTLVDEGNNAISETQPEVVNSNVLLATLHNAINASVPLDRRENVVCNCGFARPLSHESTDGADDLIMSAADLNQLCSLPQQHISDVLDLCLQRGCWKYYLTVARRLGWCMPVTAELVVQLADERLLSMDCLYGYQPTSKEEWLQILKLMEKCTVNTDETNDVSNGLLSTSVALRSTSSYRRKCIRCDTVFVLGDESQCSGEVCTNNTQLSPHHTDTQQSNNASNNKACIHIPLIHQKCKRRLDGDMVQPCEEDCCKSSAVHLLTWRRVAAQLLRQLGPTLTLQLLSEVKIPPHELPVDFFVSVLRFGACQLRKRFLAEKITTNLKVLMSVANSEQEMSVQSTGRRLSITKDYAELLSESNVQCAACDQLLVDNKTSPQPSNITLFACGCVYHSSCCATFDTCIRHTTRC